MSKPVIHNATSLNQAIEKLQQHLLALLEKHERDDVLLLTAGGSALRALDFTPNHFPKTLTLGITDERFSQNPTVNNCLQAKQTRLFTSASTAGATIIDTVPRDDDSPEMLADRFDRTLRDWQTTHPKGAIIGLFGIGPDGHTAGMFPHPETRDSFSTLFLTTQKWVASYNAAPHTPFTERLTTTYPFLHTIQYPLVFACGQDKKSALKRAFTTPPDLPTTPASIFQKLPNTHVFTDVALIVL